LPGYVCPFVLLVSSLYCKLVLLFLIYTILTFDQKKKKINPDQRLNFEPTTPIKGLGHMNEDNTSSEVMRIT